MIERRAVQGRRAANLYHRRMKSQWRPTFQAARLRSRVASAGSELIAAASPRLAAESIPLEHLVGRQGEELFERRRQAHVRKDLDRLGEAAGLERGSERD